MKKIYYIRPDEISPTGYREYASSDYVVYKDQDGIFYIAPFQGATPEICGGLEDVDEYFQALAPWYAVQAGDYIDLDIGSYNEIEAREIAEEIARCNPNAFVALIVVSVWDSFVQDEEIIQDGSKRIPYTELVGRW